MMLTWLRFLLNKMRLPWAGDEDQLHKRFCRQFSAPLKATGKDIMDIFKGIWTEEPTGDQQTEQTRENKASGSKKAEGERL